MVQNINFTDVNKLHAAIRCSDLSNLNNLQYETLASKGLENVNALHVAFRSANIDTILTILKAIKDQELINLLSEVDDDAMAPLEWLFDRDDTEQALSSILKSCTQAQKELILSFQIPSRSNQTLLHAIAEIEYENPAAPLLNVVKNALHGERELFGKIIDLQDKFGRTIAHEDLLGKKTVDDLEKVSKSITFKLCINNLLYYKDVAWSYMPSMSTFSNLLSFNTPSTVSKIKPKNNEVATGFDSFGYEVCLALNKTIVHKKLVNHGVYYKAEPSGALQGLIDKISGLGSYYLGYAFDAGEHAVPIESMRDGIVNASVGVSYANTDSVTYGEVKRRVINAKKSYEAKKQEENIKNMQYCKEFKEYTTSYNVYLKHLEDKENGEVLLEEEARMNFVDEADGDASPTLRLRPTSPSASSLNSTPRKGRLSAQSPTGSILARKNAAEVLLQEKHGKLTLIREKLKAILEKKPNEEPLVPVGREYLDIVAMSCKYREDIDLLAEKASLEQEKSRIIAEIQEIELLKEQLEREETTIPKSDDKKIKKINKRMAALRPEISAIEGQKIDPNSPKLSERQKTELSRLSHLKEQKQKLELEKRKMVPDDSDIQEEKKSIVGELVFLSEHKEQEEKHTELIDTLSKEYDQLKASKTQCDLAKGLSLEDEGKYKRERIKAQTSNFLSGISTFTLYDHVIFKQFNITPPQEYYSYIRPGLVIASASVQAYISGDNTHLYNGFRGSRLIDRAVDPVISGSPNEKEWKLAADVTTHAVMPVLGRTAGMVYANKGLPSFEMWRKGIPGKLVACTTVAALGTNYLASKIHSQIGYGIAQISSMALHANTFLNGGRLVKAFELWNAEQVMFGGDGVYANAVNFGSHFGFTNSHKGQAAIRQDHYNTPIDDYHLNFAAPLAAHIHCGRGEISANMADFGSQVRHEFKHITREYNTPLERFWLNNFVDTTVGYVAGFAAMGMTAVVASIITSRSKLISEAGFVFGLGGTVSSLYDLYKGGKRVDLSHKNPEEIWCSSTSTGGEDLGLESNGQRVVCHAWKDMHTELHRANSTMIEDKGIYPESISQQQAKDYLEARKAGIPVTGAIDNAGIKGLRESDSCNNSSEELEKVISEQLCQKYKLSECTIEGFVQHINNAEASQIELMAHDIAQFYHD